MNAPKHLRAVPDVIDETTAAARSDARWAAAPTYEQYVEADGLDDWQTRIRLIRARDALAAQLENDEPDDGAEDMWRCPACGALVDPSDVRRHYDSDCSADDDQPDDGAEALARECETLREERVELFREIDRLKGSVEHFASVARVRSSDLDEVRALVERFKVENDVGKRVNEQARAELERLYKVQAQLVDAAGVVRGVCRDADRGHYRTRDDLWWLNRLDALAERLPADLDGA